MAQSGGDQRRTKKDLKRKRIARGYKRGGQFRAMNVSEVSDDGEDVKKSAGKSKKGNKKY